MQHAADTCAFLISSLQQSEPLGWLCICMSSLLLSPVVCLQVWSRSSCSDWCCETLLLGVKEIFHHRFTCVIFIVCMRIIEPAHTDGWELLSQSVGSTHSSLAGAAYLCEVTVTRTVVCLSVQRVPGRALHHAEAPVQRTGGDSGLSVASRQTAVPRSAGKPHT